MLYTGLIGKTPLKDYKTILLVLLGNFTGTALMCLYVIFLGDPSLFDNLIVTKESYSLIYVLISSIFCGILMCVATVLNKDKNITILSITHDIEEAAMSDYVVLLSGGKIIDTGKPEDVLMNKKQIESLKLDIPFAYKISKGLQNLGIQINSHINKEKLVEELCQLHLKK
jgi:ABC-type oligopeptide transport system ATPase subunit